VGAGTAGPFGSSRACFEGIASWLDGADAGRLEHGELEEQLGAQARELTRLLYQDHLDLRAAREERLEAVAGADGVTRTRSETGHQRALATVFGEVAVTRIAYRAPGAANLHPADAALNLPAETHSHGLRGLAAAAAADISAFWAARRPGPRDSDVALVLSFDGKGIVMRPEALREATAKAAAAARRKLVTRLSPGEKNGRKRMAEIAAV
jgi:hypothetical protein